MKVNDYSIFKKICNLFTCNKKEIVLELGMNLKFSNDSTITLLNKLYKYQ